MSEWFDVCQAQPSQVGRIQWTQPIDVPKRIAAGRIAESRSVRHGADSTAIEHDQDDAAESAHGGKPNTVHRLHRFHITNSPRYRLGQSVQHQQLAVLSRPVHRPLTTFTDSSTSQCKL